MTMAQMDEYIELKGFLVERKYHPDKSEYEFRISDGKFWKKYYWKYELSSDAKLRSLDKMLSDFVKSKKQHDRFESSMSSSSTLVGDITSGYEYIEDLPTIKHKIEYLKRKTNADEVCFESMDGSGFKGAFTLRKDGFYMKHVISDMRCARDVVTELDYIIDKFNNAILNTKNIEEVTKMSPYILKKPFRIPELNNRKLEIKKVHFNDPMTIVIWSDGTKTIVKAHNEPFDREKGLAMAITKKFLGNKYNYAKEFKKWLE